MPTIIFKKKKINSRQDHNMEKSGIYNTPSVYQMLDILLTIILLLLLLLLLLSNNACLHLSLYPA